MERTTWRKKNTGMTLRNNFTRVQKDEFRTSYGEDETVRVSIQIEENEDKDTVIERISQEVFGNAEWDIHNKNLADDFFTANVPYGKVEQIRRVSGVKGVSISRESQIMNGQTAGMQTGVQNGSQQPGEQTAEEPAKEESDSEKSPEQETEKEEESANQEKETQTLQKEHGKSYDAAAGGIAGAVIFLLAILFIYRKRRS